MVLVSHYAALWKPPFSWAFADKQNVDTFPQGVCWMDCFRGNHPLLDGHVNLPHTRPTAGEKILTLTHFVLNVFLFWRMNVRRIKPQGTREKIILLYDYIFSYMLVNHEFYESSLKKICGFPNLNHFLEKSNRNWHRVCARGRYCPSRPRFSSFSAAVKANTDYGFTCVHF